MKSALFRKLKQEERELLAQNTKSQEELNAKLSEEKEAYKLGFLSCYC